MVVSLFRAVSAFLIALALIGMQAGVLAPGDAAFASIAIAVVYAASLLYAREGAPLWPTLKALFLEPRSYASQAHYYSFVATTALAGLVVLGAVAA
ncbi:MAG: hypothetical protein GC199_11215 [Alphaproteobacteria bacterium]|nr:hypothetical protein [Alphaproteobacteria bacterium]